VNLEHLSGVEKDKKDLLTLVSQLENLAKQLSGEREEDKQKIIKRLQGVVKELNSTKLDRKIYNLTWKAYERLLKM
jgi:guanylate kinase